MATTRKRVAKPSIAQPKKKASAKCSTAGLRLLSEMRGETSRAERLAMNSYWRSIERSG